MVTASVENRPLDWIKVADITPNPHNPRGPNVREQDNRFQALRESIAVFGVLVPLVVQDIGGGKFQLIDGERRYHVAKSLRMEQVPAIIVRDQLDPDLVRQFMAASQWKGGDDL